MARVNLGEFLKNLVIAIVWFLLLWFIAFPVAFFCAPWFIFLQPLEVLCHCGLNAWLFKVRAYEGQLPGNSSLL